MWLLEIRDPEQRKLMRLLPENRKPLKLNISFTATSPSTRCARVPVPDHLRPKPPHPAQLQVRGEEAVVAEVLLVVLPRNDNPVVPSLAAEQSALNAERTAKVALEAKAVPVAGADQAVAPVDPRV